MYPRARLPVGLLDRQLITTSELRARGLTPDAIRGLVGRELTRVSKGLLAVGDEPGWERRIDAGLLIAGPGSLAYGPTAGALHGLVAPSDPVWILAPPGSHPRSRPWLRVVRSRYAGRAVLDKIEPRRVGIDDTILDLADCGDQLTTIAVVTRALQERRTTPERVLAAMGPRARQRHRVLLGMVLRDAAGIESVLEMVHRERVERAHGLTPLVRQYDVPETGHRADGFDPARGLLVELDGAEFHDRDADQALDTRHATVGYPTARLGWTDCFVRPCSTARIMNGGAPPPRRCRRCPP